MAIVVKANPNESSDSVIRRFQKVVLSEGLVKEIRKREFHRKPSQLRQEYLAEKRRKIMRARRFGS